MSDEKDHTLDKIKNIHSFMENSKFYKIYDVFHKKCTDYPEDRNESCYTEESGNMIYSPDVNNILEDLYSNLYRVYFSILYDNNTYFENISSEYEKMCCTSLKYWLYDQIMTKGLEGTKINAIFTGWETYLKNKIKNISPDLCIFNNLQKDEIKKIKNIYALYAILYNNNTHLETCDKNTCKYIEYFGKGLDELISSINSCSTNPSTINYCKQLEEFLDLCKEDKEDAGISIHEESTKSKAHRDGKYLLSSQKYKDKELYIYIKNDKLLNFVKTSDFLSNKYSTIAATSVVGSAIGLSSIFYYLYKFTPFGSSLRRGKGMNTVNMDEEAHNSSLYKSNTENLPLQNREYKVAYHTFNDA